MRIATVSCFLLAAMSLQPALNARLAEAFDEIAADWLGSVRGHLRASTTTDYTAIQIHQIGLEQVARLEKQFSSVR
jgi:uncharacterized protein (DUF885 family)